MIRNLVLILTMVTLTSCGTFLNRERAEFMKKWGDDTLIETILPELDLSEVPMYHNLLVDVLSRCGDASSTNQMLFHLYVDNVNDGTLLCTVLIHENKYDPEKSAGWESKDNRGYVILNNHIFLLNIPKKYYKGFKEKSNGMNFGLYNKYNVFPYDPPTFEYRISNDKFQYISPEERDAMFID